jgi:hypothetical protein
MPAASSPGHRRLVMIADAIYAMDSGGVLTCPLRRPWPSSRELAQPSNRGSVPLPAASVYRLAYKVSKRV